MELQFLEIGEFTRKENFLQHITRLVQIDLKPTDTYFDLFRKLEHTFNSGDEKVAVDEFIQYNKENVSKSDLESIITDEKDMYAIFNLRN